MAIRSENLMRDYTDIKAVDDLTLEIPKGIVFGLLGPNGAGKTTIIQFLLGLIEPSEVLRARVLGLDSQTQAGIMCERSDELIEYIHLLKTGSN